jgi:acetyl-CoA C-acetyltransferase
MALASQAATNALNDAGVKGLAEQIDTICVTRLFSDMGHLWPCKWGRSDNPPQSIAQTIGATPAHRIYTQTGGNEPQSRLIEFAQDIARGERSVVLLVGAEALKNQRHAERNQNELDWNEQFTEELDDREIGISVATSQELNNGLHNVMYYYALIEQAQRHDSGRSIAEHQQAMAALLESFSKVANSNPYAQFPGKQTAADILAAPALSHLYTKRMIAQDGVNQGAALLMCSVAKAREMGIPESNWVFLHGLAEGSELELTRRPDPGRSEMAGLVTRKALSTADLNIDDIDQIDIYSCFPCAVTAVAEHLDLPVDGSRPLTLTGGLPYFGGPGNNYSMHALVEAIWRARNEPYSYVMVTANGGMLSKHAAGIYSGVPSTTDWANTETTVNREELESREVCEDPGTGTIISYTAQYDREGIPHAIILAETDHGQRFVSITAKDDSATASAIFSEDPTGKRVLVAASIDGRLHFQLA